MRNFLLISWAALLVINIPAARTSTIASTSLCGDNYLLALADENISALSWQSRSPLSVANGDQRKLPQIWDDLEILRKTDTEFILLGPDQGHLKQKLDKKSITLSWGEDFETVFENAKTINEALSLDSEISQKWAKRLEELSLRAAKRQTKPNILYLSRSGGSAGQDTFVDTVITKAGGKNVVDHMGWFTPDPEDIIRYQPDLIITSYFKNGYESVQSTAFRNKVVRRYIAQYPTVEIDGKLWPCAGPGLIEAAELVSEAIDKLP